MRRSLNVVAILVGISIDVILSVGLVLGVVVALMAGGVDFDDDAAMQRWYENPVFLVAEFAASLLPTVLAGYVTGKMAKFDQLRHALWVGGVMLILYAVLTFIPMEGPSEPLWFDLASLVVIVPAALAGGYLSIPGTKKAAP